MNKVSDYIKLAPRPGSAVLASIGAYQLGKWVVGFCGFQCMMNQVAQRVSYRIAEDPFGSVMDLLFSMMLIIVFLHAIKLSCRRVLSFIKGNWYMLLMVIITTLWVSSKKVITTHRWQWGVWIGSGCLSVLWIFVYLARGSGRVQTVQVAQAEIYRGGDKLGGLLRKIDTVLAQHEMILSRIGHLQEPRVDRPGVLEQLAAVLAEHLNSSVRQVRAIHSDEIDALRQQVEDLPRQIIDELELLVNATHLQAEMTDHPSDDDTSMGHHQSSSSMDSSPAAKRGRPLGENTTVQVQISNPPGSQIQTEQPRQISTPEPTRGTTPTSNRRPAPRVTNSMSVERNLRNGQKIELVCKETPAHKVMVDMKYKKPNRIEEYKRQVQYWQRRLGKEEEFVQRQLNRGVGNSVSSPSSTTTPTNMTPGSIIPPIERAPDQPSSSLAESTTQQLASTVNVTSPNASPQFPPEVRGLDRILQEKPFLAQTSQPSS